MDVFTGRRIDLEQLASQARALWEAREGLAARSQMTELFSHAVLLTLFAAIVSAVDQMTQFHLRALPSTVLPFAVIAIALLILRRIKFQVNVQLPHVCVQLPFDTAPFLQRMSLQLTGIVERVNTLITTLPLPHLHLDQSEAAQSVLLFAQRVTANLLELRAVLATLIERVYKRASIQVDVTSSSLQCPPDYPDQLTRQLKVVVLRC
jgi:membrane-associated HD superfamily phosphohydrolase